MDADGWGRIRILEDMYAPSQNIPPVDPQKTAIFQGYRIPGMTLHKPVLFYTPSPSPTDSRCRRSVWEGVVEAHTALESRCVGGQV